MSNRWFSTIRHNELRDVFASMLSDVYHDVYHDVEVELMLLPLSGEILPQKSNTRKHILTSSLVDCGVDVSRRHILTSESLTPMPSCVDQAAIASCYKK